MSIFLLTNSTVVDIYINMNRQTTIRRCINLDLTLGENEALDLYLKNNGLKFKALLRLLLIKELQTKNVVNSAEYTPPKVEDCLVKSKR